MNSFAPGYGPAVSALIFVFAYLSLTALLHSEHHIFLGPHCAIRSSLARFGGRNDVGDIVRTLHNFLGRYLVYVILGTFASFIVTVRIIRGPFDKFVSRPPGSTAPRRPWTGADQKPFTFFLLILAGVALLALATSNAAGLLTASFMAVNAVFFHALQGLMPAGRKIAAQLEDYRKFIFEVEADPISRSNSPERVPEKLSEKDAYALAFGLDLGGGEQFVTAIGDLVECADVMDDLRAANDPAS